MSRRLNSKKGETANNINLRFVNSCAHCEFSDVHDENMGEEGYISCRLFPELNFKYEIDFTTICDHYQS